MITTSEITITESRRSSYWLGGYGGWFEDYGTIMLIQGPAPDVSTWMAWLGYEI